MSFIVKIAAAMSHFFSAWEKAARPAWEYRIRFSVEKRAWVIELHENGDRVWQALTKLGSETENELHVHKFENYQSALQHAISLGLPLAYEQAYFTANRKPLHPATLAIEHGILQASGGSMSQALPMARHVRAVPSAVSTH